MIFLAAFPSFVLLALTNSFIAPHYRMLHTYSKKPPKVSPWTVSRVGKGVSDRLWYSFIFLNSDDTQVFAKFSLKDSECVLLSLVVLVLFWFFFFHIKAFCLLFLEMMVNQLLSSIFKCYWRLNKEFFCPSCYVCFKFKLLSRIYSVSVWHLNEWPIPPAWFTKTVLPLIFCPVSLRPE